MTVRRRRWWLLAALRRGRIARGVDRMELFAAIGCLLLIVLAINPVTAVAESVYISNSAAFAKEAATRHTVDAVAVSSSQTAVRGMGRAYQVHVQWFAKNETRDKVLRIDHAVTAGEHLPIWVNDEGDATTSPRTAADAHADAIGAGAVLWAGVLAAVIAALAMLRAMLDKVRYRAWDRSWYAFADNDGGWATRNS